MAREFLDKRAERLLDTAAKDAVIKTGKKEFIERKSDGEVCGPDRMDCKTKDVFADNTQIDAGCESDGKGCESENVFPDSKPDDAGVESDVTGYTEDAGLKPPANLGIASQPADNGVLSGDMIELVIMKQDGTISRAGKGMPTTVEKPSDRIAPLVPADDVISHENVRYFYLTQGGLITEGIETLPTGLADKATTGRDIRRLFRLLGIEDIAKEAIEFVITRKNEIIWGGKDLPTGVDRPRGPIRDQWSMLFQDKPLLSKGLSISFKGGKKDGSYSDRLDLEIRCGDKKKPVSIPFSEDSRIDMPDFGKRIDISPNSRTDKLVTAYLEISDL